MAGKGKTKKSAPILAPSQESRLVAQFIGCNGKDGCNDNFATELKEHMKFRRDFLAAVRGEGNGLLTRHLFFDPKDYKINGQITDGETILWGSNAWDAHEASNADVDFGDAALIRDMVSNPAENMLLRTLPNGKYSIYEYGPGEEIAVATKTIPLIRSLMDHKQTHPVKSYTAHDIVPHYAIDPAQQVNQELGLSTNAVVGNALRREGVEIIQQQGNQLVIIFGGMLMNAPEFLTTGKTSQEVLCDYFTTLNLRHGPGSYVLMTLDIERDIPALLKRYSQTPAFECFSLSAMARAVHEGVITDKDYDVLDHWEAHSSFNDKRCRIEIDAVAKKDHILRTVEGDIEIKKGHKISTILSDKNSIKYVERVANVAGLKLVDVFPQTQRSKCAILLRVDHTPSP